MVYDINETEEHKCLWMTAKGGPNGGYKYMGDG